MELQNIFLCKGLLARPCSPDPEWRACLHCPELHCELWEPLFTDLPFKGGSTIGAHTGSRLQHRAPLQLQRTCQGRQDGEPLQMPCSQALAAYTCRPTKLVLFTAILWNSSQGESKAGEGFIFLDKSFKGSLCLINTHTHIHTHQNWKANSVTEVLPCKNLGLIPRPTLSSEL